MRDLYTKKVEVSPGDTLVLANGETWEITGDLRYLMVEEDTIIEATGPIVVRPDLKKIRIRMKKR
jgi:hypothetical protein